jgi:hypothetical protein
LRGSSKRGRFTKQRVTCEYADKAKIFEEERWWHSSKSAAGYLEISDVTLGKWASTCPWLDGRGIETRPLVGALGRTYRYYAKKDLDDVRKAKARRLRVEQYDGLTHIKSGAEELGIAYTTLKQIRPKPILRPGRDARGRATLRSYVDRSFLDAQKAKRRASESPSTGTVAPAVTTKHASVESRAVTAPQATSPSKPRARQGRPPKPETTELMLFCSQERARGLPLSEILDLAHGIFEERAPQTEAEVSTYAKRWDNLSQEEKDFRLKEFKKWENAQKNGG